MQSEKLFPKMSERFRGYLPVVVDVETGGFNAQTDALLEIAAVLVEMDEIGNLRRGKTLHANIEPFAGANIEAEALQFNGIDPHHPFRNSCSEYEGLQDIFKPIRQAIKETGCKRAILVGHNAFFDLSFLNAAVARSGIKRNPFHPFSTFDTVSLSGLAFGQTVLARAAKAAGMEWSHSDAHSAIYDAEQTTDLFCRIVNLWQQHAPNLIQRITLEENH